MTRLRLLLVVAGAGTLLAGMPSQAAVRTQPDPSPSGAAAGETRALELLSAASRAARSRSYSGTQYVSTWREETASSSVADIRHSPSEGSVVQVRPTADGELDSSVTPTTDLDPRLVRLLSEHYVLDVAGPATCTGRPVEVVEAHHPGDGVVVGRFWIDVASSLVLRREIFDRSGRLVRSSAFATLSIDPSGGPRIAAATLTTGQLDAAAIDDLRRQGWRIPAALPGDLELFDARMRTHDGQRVLHLSYSDGLSTLSLFAQRGRLGSGRMAGFTKQKVGRSAVWVRPSSPERVVWGGGGRVFTLLSDASPEAVRAAVTALPHEKAPRTGFLARLGRGLARVGSWLNPFS
ncbi:MAG: putative sigma regulatory protein MucB/RseB [Frankiales bacterium]|nr:putative sigma regulatory protein MucB/RseB [Frankiales bacterium]